jgi:hypothetical protein
LKPRGNPFKGTLPVLLSLAAFVPAAAQAEWAMLAPQADAAASAPKTFTDVSSLAWEGPYRKAWTLTEWGQPQAEHGVTFLSRLQLDLYSCRKRTHAVRQQHYHAESGGAGARVLSVETPRAELKWEEIVPGTPLDAMFRLVCQKPAFDAQAGEAPR